MELISVIIPVYNVKDFLEECINSVINQSYQNLQILLIDDGSKDESGKLCDLFSKKDSRISVFHKKNGGLSDARNFGLEKAIGEYIAFVDSDDVLHVDFIKNLYLAMKNNDADIGICRYQRFIQIKEKIQYKEVNEYLMNSFDVLKNILFQRDQTLFSVAACTKLYNKHIFDHIRFPVGKLNEDVAVIIPIMKKANKIAVVDQILYNYRLNENSITTSNFSVKRMDVISILNDMKLKYADNKIISKGIISMLYCRSIELMYLASTDSQNAIYVEELWRYIKTYRWIILSSKDVRPMTFFSACISLLGKNTLIRLMHIKKNREVKKIRS